MISYLVFVAANYYYMKKMCIEKLQGVVIFNIGNLCVLSVGFLLSVLLALLAYPYPILRWGAFCLIVISGLAFHKRIIQILKKKLSV